MAKSLFSSQTILASLFASGLSGYAFLSNPTNIGKASDCAKSFGQEQLADDLRKYAGLLSSIAPFIAIVGRVKAGGIYTPRWMAGPNKEDLQEQANQPIDSIASRLDELSNQVKEIVPVAHSTQVQKLDEFEKKIVSKFDEFKPVVFPANSPSVDMHEKVAELVKAQNPARQKERYLA